MSDFTKIGVATAIPAIYLHAALEEYEIYFYRIFLSLCMVAKSKTLILVP